MSAVTDVVAVRICCCCVAKARHAWAGARLLPLARPRNLYVSRERTGPVGTEAGIHTEIDEALLERNPDALVVTDAQGGVLRWNREASDAFGH